MCKIIVLTNASKVKDMTEFTKLMADLLSDQRDGFGAVMHGPKGVYGVKSLYPTRFAKGMLPLSFTKAVNDEYFGRKSPHYGPALFHGRVSTNVINLTNTHPMIKNNHYMIHNGVVENEGEDYTRDTTNDSEDVLYHYVTGGIQKVAKNISGYYACATIYPDGTLSVFRDNIASLQCAWSEKLDTFFFATTTTLIDRIGYHIKEELTPVSLKDNIYLKFKGNERLAESHFENLGYIPQSARNAAQKSLGHSLTSDTNWAGYDNMEDYSTNMLDFVTEDYINEMDTIDDTYDISDQEGHPIDADEFYSLPLDCKITCRVKRSDGTLVDPFRTTVTKMFG